MALRLRPGQKPLVFLPSDAEILERAEIRIDGKKYGDWTSVLVQHRHTESHARFTFECTEADPKEDLRVVYRYGERWLEMPKWKRLQFFPGNHCEIILAGKLAVTGYVTTRQAGYDAQNHGVQISGKSKTWDIASCSVTSYKKYDGYTFEQIARHLIAPFGIELETIGKVDATPFPQLSVGPGELVWEVLERLARSRKIVLGSTERGALLAIGEHAAAPIEALEEGGNILRANCTISDEYIYQKYYALGQRAGHDDAWGDDVSQIGAVVDGAATRYRPIVQIAEHPEVPAGLRKRAEMERLFAEGAQVTAIITVQGWINRTGELWRCGTYVEVHSEMLALDGVVLGIQAIDFRQDEPSGTTTTLTLVLPWHLNGKMDWGPGEGPGDPAKQLAPGEKLS